MIENNQVTIIKGEPGCGKSTRVPNFIMKKWSQDNKGGECNVYITQPRRISALTLANRVASERSENVCSKNNITLLFTFFMINGFIQICS